MKANFSLNELSVASVNANNVKDICSYFCIKNTEQSNIDVALTSILEQRNLYPLYPPFYNGNQDTPIEYEQYNKLFLNETPDILILPS